MLSRTMHVTSVAMTLLALALCGCGGAPQDLALSSIRVVNSQSEKELMNRWPRAHRPTRSYLKVEFTSSTNLSQYAINNDYMLITLIANSCSAEEQQYELHDYVLQIDMSSIYWRGLELDPEQHDASLANLIGSSDPPYTYYAYVDLERDGGSTGKRPFDLRSDPTDVCLFVHGAKFLSASQTNIMLLHRDRLSRILADPTDRP